VVMH